RFLVASGKRRQKIRNKPVVDSGYRSRQRFDRTRSNVPSLSSAKTILSRNDIAVGICRVRNRDASVASLAKSNLTGSPVQNVVLISRRASEEVPHRVPRLAAVALIYLEHQRAVEDRRIGKPQYLISSAGAAAKHFEQNGLGLTDRHGVCPDREQLWRTLVLASLNSRSNPVERFRLGG